MPGGDRCNWRNDDGRALTGFLLPFIARALLCLTTENHAAKHMLPPILLCLNLVSEQVPWNGTCRLISLVRRISMGQSVLFAQASSQLYIAWIYVQCPCCCLLKLELYLRSAVRRPTQHTMFRSECLRSHNVYIWNW